MIYTNPNIRASSREGYVISTFIADTVAELPPLNYLTDYTLEIGSTCHVIEDSGDYEMQSNGTWVKRIPAVLANTYTRTEIDSKIATVNSDIDILAGLQGADRQIIIDMINSGAKNLLQMTQTQTTITRTSGNSSVTAVYDKTAGTVTLNGVHYTGDNTLIFEFYSGNAVDTPTIPAGDYQLSGVPSGGSSSTYRAALMSISGGVDIGNGSTFTLNDPHYAAYRILISGNCTLDNMVFRPMITPKVIYDITPDFRPYCPTLQQLYAMVQSYHGGV